MTLPIRPHQEPDGALNVGTDGRVKESDASAGNKTGEVEAPGKRHATTSSGAGFNAEFKRNTGGDVGNQAVPKYVEQMKAGTSGRMDGEGSV